jgi:hypothetical protein
MSDDADGLQPLYLTIGYVIVKWSFVEAALDFAVSTIYTDCGGSSLRKQMPKFLKEKTSFIAKAATEIPHLAPFKARALDITGRAINIKDYREDFAHSVLTHPTHNDGVYSFVRLNAKEHNHSAKVWQFDVQTFPAMSEKLERLATDAQLFAKSLEEAFHK